MINHLAVDWMYDCDDIHDDEMSKDTTQVDDFQNNVSCCMDVDDANTFTEQDEDDKFFLHQQYDF
jgi:hypothetical protein